MDDPVGYPVYNINSLTKVTTGTVGHGKTVGTPGKKETVDLHSVIVCETVGKRTVTVKDGDYHKSIPDKLGIRS